MRRNEHLHGSCPLEGMHDISMRFACDENLLKSLNREQITLFRVPIHFECPLHFQEAETIVHAPGDEEATAACSSLHKP